MPPDQDRLTYLFHKYLQDKASDEEMDELFAYIREAKQRAHLKNQITEVFRHVREEEGFDQVDWDEMFRRIVNGPPGEVAKPRTQIKHTRFWRNIAAAVFVLAVAGAGLYLYLNKRSSFPDIALSQHTKDDILPGGNKATLILSNGAKIILDSAGNGKLTSQGNTNVMKINGGVLAYKTGNGKQKAKSNIAYNTLTTPRGGQYKLILPDGTKVWLNAASSIRYPTAFVGKERKVTITGEAYFEVENNAAMPFIVQKGDMQIKVLGTHFNISAYSDEEVEKITLLEGLISISQLVSHRSRIIRPGQQVQLNKEGRIKVVKNVNTADAVAWKNGFFSFKNDNLQSVMLKLSRWYDVDVIYQPGVNNKQEFSGKIDRNLTLSQVLNGLERTNAHFRIGANREVEILP